MGSLISLTGTITSNTTLNDTVCIDKNNQIVIKDQDQAMKVMLTFDSNSIEYRVVQIAIQAHNMREQAAARKENQRLNELASKGGVEIIRLGKILEENQKELTSLTDESTALRAEISDLHDMHTREEMLKDESALSSEAKLDGLSNIAKGILLTPLIVTTVYGIALTVSGVAQMSMKPEKFTKMEHKIELYQAFYPKASLTEAYTYVKKHPATYTKFESADIITVEAYQKKYPKAAFVNFDRYIEKSIRIEVMERASQAPRRRRTARF